MAECCQMGEPQECSAPQKKPDTAGPILCDPICMKYPQIQKVDWLLSGWGEGGE